MLTRNEKAKKFLKIFYTYPYRDRKERNNKRVFNIYK